MTRKIPDPAAVSALAHMTPDQIFDSSVAAGIHNPDGTLTPPYRPKTMTPGFVTVRQAAQLLGVSERTAFRRLRRHCVKRRCRSDKLSRRRLMVPVAALTLVLEGSDNVPLVPEVLEIREEIAEMREWAFKLTRRLKRLESVVKGARA